MNNHGLFSSIRLTTCQLPFFHVHQVELNVHRRCDLVLIIVIGKPFSRYCFIKYSSQAILFLEYSQYGLDNGVPW